MARTLSISLHLHNSLQERPASGMGFVGKARKLAFDDPSSFTGLELYLNCSLFCSFLFKLYFQVLACTLHPNFVLLD
jgi:hypothetical protein